MNIPGFRDVLLAQRQIRPYLPRTPLHSYPALNALLGIEAYIKHENYQPVGAFKVRGGVNLISQLSPVCASSSASAASSRARISSARAASSRPASVSRMPRPTRCTRRLPVSASSRARWWLTEGWA